MQEAPCLLWFCSFPSTNPTGHNYVSLMVRVHIFTQSIYWGSAVSPTGGLYCFSVGVGGLSSWYATCTHVQHTVGHSHMTAFLKLPRTTVSGSRWQTDEVSGQTEGYWCLTRGFNCLFFYYYYLNLKQYFYIPFKNEPPRPPTNTHAPSSPLDILEVQKAHREIKWSCYILIKNGLCSSHNSCIIFQNPAANRATPSSPWGSFLLTHWTDTNLVLH